MPITVNLTGDISDTAALQAALDSSNNPSIYLQGSLARLNKLNATNKDSITLRGDGPGMEVQADVNGGTLFDLTGSKNIHMEGFRITNYDTAIPDYIFKWLAVPGRNPVTHLSVEGIMIEAKTAKQHLYGYGFSGLRICRSVWRQRLNGTLNSDFTKLTAVAKIDANNEDGVGSEYTTVITGQSAALLFTTHDCTMVDEAQTNSNNAVLIGVTAGQMATYNTRLQGLGIATLVQANFCEGNQFFNTFFESQNGAANAVKYWVVFCNGLNGNMTFVNPFFSIPSQTFLAIGEPIGQNGGLANLVVINNDIGGNQGRPFIGLTFGQPATSLLQNWIDGGDIDLQGTGVVAAAGISASTVFRRYDPSGGPISKPSDASDLSTKFPTGWIVPPTGTFLNPNDKNAGILLSNKNLTVTNDGRPVHELVRANTSILSTDVPVYWEVTVATDTSSVNIVGIQDASLSTADGNYLGSGGVGVGLGYSSAGGSFYSSGFSTSGLAIPIGNQTLGIAYKPATGQGWIRNSSGYINGDPATGMNPSFTINALGTTIYPAVSLYGNKKSFTFNFGSSPFLYSIPNGFSIRQ